MTAITLYALRHMTDSLTVDQMALDEFIARNLILDLLAGSFSAYLLPIYTLKDDFTLLEYHALPASKLSFNIFYFKQLNVYVLDTYILTGLLNFYSKFANTNFF